MLKKIKPIPQNTVVYIGDNDEHTKIILQMLENDGYKTNGVEKEIIFCDDLSYFRSFTQNLAVMFTDENHVAVSNVSNFLKHGYKMIGFKTFIENYTYELYDEMMTIGQILEKYRPRIVYSGEFGHVKFIDRIHCGGMTILTFEASDGEKFFRLDDGRDSVDGDVDIWPDSKHNKMSWEDFVEEQEDELNPEKKLEFEDVQKHMFKEGAWQLDDTCGEICFDNHANETYPLNATSGEQMEKLIALNKMMTVRNYLLGEHKITEYNPTYYFYLNLEKEVEIASCYGDYYYDGKIHFPSMSDAQQAREILGDGVIKTALLNEW